MQHESDGTSQGTSLGVHGRVYDYRGGIHGLVYPVLEHSTRTIRIVLVVLLLRSDKVFQVVGRSVKVERSPLSVLEVLHKYIVVNFSLLEG